MSYDARPGIGELHRFGAVAPVLKGLTIPNDLEFSPGGRLICLADSARGVVHRIVVDRHGELSARPSSCTRSAAPRTA